MKSAVTKKLNEEERVHQSRSTSGPEHHIKNSPAEKLLALHHTIGNHAIGQVIQAKLDISQPNDPLEKEADRVADHIMQMSQPTIQRQSFDKNAKVQKPLNIPITPVLQRKVGIEEETEDQEEELLQKKSTSGNSPLVSLSTETQIQSLKGGGEPLSNETRSFMEPRFGRNFNDVRVHTNAQANNTAKSLHAKAFTVGKHVVFGQGEYQPKLESGRKLIAHELTHVVQQNQFNNLNRKIQRKKNVAKAKPLSFEFSLDLEGETRFNVAEGGGIQIYADANFVDKSILSSKYKPTYYIELVEEGRISNTSHGAGIFSAGKGSSHKWINLPEGTYFLRFIKNYPELIKGIVWIDMLSPAGVQSSVTKTEDKFEIETGIPTKELKNVVGIARGYYNIRSEPIESSFIFGELKGRSRVQVIDKKAYKREDPDREFTWYKVQFKDKKEFEKLVMTEPPEIDTIARKMYESRQAWISAKIFIIYVPYETFLKQLNAFEKRPEVASLPLLKRVTMLRQLHADTKIPFDIVIGTEKGERNLESRPEISNLVQMLKYEPTGIVLKNDELVDIAHFLITLDAYAHDNWFASEKLGSSHALASWLGDVGAASAHLIDDYIKEIVEKKTVLPIEFYSSLIATNFEKSASDADLLGNLDGLGAYLLLREHPNVKSIEELVRLYYEGSPSNKSSKSDKDFGGLSNRRQAISAFLASYGFSDHTNLSKSKGAKDCMLWETNRFATVWLMKLRAWDEILFVLGSSVLGSKDMKDVFSKLIGNASIIMVDLFLKKMQKFATTYGVNTIPKSAYLNINCRPFFYQHLKEEDKKKILPVMEKE